MTPVANGKIFKQKIFNNFVWAPLGSRVNIYINFCLQVHFKVSAAWYCSHYLPPASIAASIVDTGGSVNSTRGTGGKICSWCRWYCWQIYRRCRWYQRQFATGVIDTGGKFATGGKLTCEFLREFSKKFETVLMGYSGTVGKLIHKKTRTKNLDWGRVAVLGPLYSLAPLYKLAKARRRSSVRVRRILSK